MNQNPKASRRISGVIYEPKGRAKEYSYLACNLYGSIGPDGRQYSAGCVHGCSYCYVPEALHIPKEIFHGKYGIEPRMGILKRLIADAEKLAGTNKRVLLCFSCDAYMPEGVTIDVTREALLILRKFDIPFQVLTKGGMRAARDFDLYGPNDAFATTLTFNAVQDSIRYEPKAAMPYERLNAIARACSNGIITWVSFEPVIDPEQTLLLMKECCRFASHIKIGKLNHQASNIDWRDFGCRAIALCENFDVPYYIKDDLAKYLDGVEFHNTDTRCVVRND